jgi:hypothetical protein
MMMCLYFIILGEGVCGWWNLQYGFFFFFFFFCYEMNEVTFFQI